MNLYEELLSKESDLEELMIRCTQIQQGENREEKAAFHQWLNRFTRTQLILICACSRIGLTGQGELWDADVTNGAPASFYALPLYESPNRLLERYASFYAFESRESLTDTIRRYIPMAEHMRIGLDLLKKSPKGPEEQTGSSVTIRHSDEPGSVREALRAEHDPSDQGDISLKVAMDNSDGQYLFFEFREDAGRQIEQLRNRFYDWMYGQKGIHPFRIHHKTYERGELTYDDWYYIQGPQDFVSWINTQIYGEQVGREMKTCPIKLTQASAMLSF